MSDESDVDIPVPERLLRDVLAHRQDRHRENERLVQIGMRAVIRDIQDYINDPDLTWSYSSHETYINVRQLHTYLLALLITSGAYDDADDPFGALRHQLTRHGQS